MVRQIFVEPTEGRCFALDEYRRAIAEAAAFVDLRGFADALEQAVRALEAATDALIALRAAGGVNRALANATLYLDAFGHVALGWIWLRQAMVASRALARASAGEESFYRGKLAACRYFFRYEIPKVAERCALLGAGDATCLEMDEDWF